MIIVARPVCVVQKHKTHLEIKKLPPGYGKHRFHLRFQLTGFWLCWGACGAPGGRGEGTCRAAFGLRSGFRRGKSGLHRTRPWVTPIGGAREREPQGKCHRKHTALTAGFRDEGS